MNSRQQYITQAADIDVRLKIWSDQIKAIERHIELGKSLQMQGIEILNNLSTEEISVEVVIKAISQATGIIEKGIAIEQQGREQLSDLYQRKPIDE